MRLLLIIALVLVSIGNSFGQNDLFPVAKNGKWGLVENTGKFILKYQYDYIEYHQASNQFVYEFKGKRGLIGGNGQVNSKPIYDDIQLLDSSWSTYKKNDKWNLAFQSKVLFEFEYDSIVPVTPEIFMLYKDQLGTFYHCGSKTKSVNEHTLGSFFKDGIIVGHFTDNKYALYSTNDLSLLSANVDTFYTKVFNYAVAVIDGQLQLINMQQQKLVGEPMTDIDYQFGNLFMCHIGYEPRLFNGKKDEYYQVPELDFILDYNYPTLTYVKAGKQGLWDLERSRNILLPKYEVAEIFDREIMAGDFGRFGIFDLSGNAILPMEFQSIDVHDNVYVVQQSGQYGVYSKRGKEIVPVVYDKIKVFDNNIKCYSKKAITIIKLGTDGSVKSKKTYTDYMSISIEKERVPRRRSTNLNFGGNARDQPKFDNTAYGWYRPILKRKKNDSLIETRGRWGLKDTADSVVIRPQFMEIIIDNKQNLTKAYLSKRSTINQSAESQLIKKGWAIKLSNSSHGIFHPTFNLVDNETRKFLTKRTFLSVNLDDFEVGYYARSFYNGLFLLDPLGDAHWENLKFYGDYSDSILRICTEGETVLSPSKTKFTATTTRNFLHTAGAVKFKLSKLEKYIEFEEATWFYLDKNGNQLNEKPFQFAEEFKHGLAIVAINDKWGVVDTAMNIIVPIEHEKVKRVFIDGASYFEVSKRVKENYLYQKSTGKLSPTEIGTLKHYHKGTWFAQKKGSSAWALIDTNLQNITPYEFDYVYPFKDGYATIIIRGKKSIIDPNGNSVLPFYKSKRIEPLGYYRYAIVTSKGMTVVDLGADTLLKAINCKRVIESTADYLVYEERGRRINFLNFKNDFHTPKNSTILSYSLKDEIFLVQKNGKKRLFSIATGEYISKPLEGITEVGEDAMIYRGKNGLLGFQSFQGDTLCQPQFKKLAPLKNGWAFSKTKRKKGIVNANGNYLFDDPVYRVGELDENSTFIMHTGIGVINPAGKVIIPPEYQKIELYNTSFYKAIKNNRTCDVYTRAGKKLNDKSYQDIKTISTSALIVKHKGFDYLYNGVLNKSLSFQNIRPVSSDLYLLDENSHVGMYNATGEIIVPLRYHKIEVVRDHLQVSFFNSFGYFDYDGKDLADPHFKSEI
ncbi:MAG: hypothetical protein GQ574_04810 [Crocinitomix sp.]|nr:hypothetical protein [Crocinitomix sp.]